MTAISNSYIKFDAFQELPEPKRARPTPAPYTGLGWINIPSPINILYIPKDFIASVIDQIKARKISDKEGAFENWMRIMEAPFNLSSSLLNIVKQSCKLLVNFHALSGHDVFPFSNNVAKYIPFLGLMMSFFEVIIEGTNLHSSRQMLNKFDISELKYLRNLTNPQALHAHFLKLTKNPSSLKEVLSKEELDAFVQSLNLPSNNLKELGIWRDKIMDRLTSQLLRKISNEYCELSPKKIAAIDKFVKDKFPQLSILEQQNKKRECENLLLTVSDRRLIRRVLPRAARELHDKVPELIREMNEKSTLCPTCRDRSYALLDDLDMQSRKKIILHSIGLLAAFVSIAAIMAALCACPYVAILVLLIFSTGLTTMRWGIREGCMDSKGWHFEAANLVPKVVKTLYHKIFTRSIQRRQPELIELGVLLR